MTVKMIANWDYQLDTEWRPSPAQAAWWNESNLRNYKYVYRAEFWLNEAGQKFAVLFSYRVHPLTGERYVERRAEGSGWVAINDPVVVEIEEFPPA